MIFYDRKRIFRSSGFLLIEILISILILMIIVIGGVYSYTVIQQRVLFQRNQRMFTTTLQGWMEYASIRFQGLDPNDPAYLEHRRHTEEELEERFRNELAVLFGQNNFANPNVEIGDVWLGNNRLCNIRIWAELNNTPIALYTEMR